MLQTIKNNKKLVSLYILAGIFFFVYSFLAFSAFDKPVKLNSPDEVANYFFAKRFAETGQISFFEPQNLLAGDVIHPRAMESINGKVVPTSFLGMILLYGFLAKIFGVWIILFLTPLLAAIGVLFFYGLIKKIFDEPIAYFSSLLLFFLPPLWYFSAKSMYHNVGFLVFLIISLYLLSNRCKNYFLKFLGSGIFLGLALSFRISEFLWVLRGYFILFLYYKKEIKIKYFIFFILGCFLALAPTFYYNNVLYGSYFSTGYTAGTEIASIEAGNDFSLIEYVTSIFGFHPRLSLSNFFNYVFKLFWFFTVPALVGFFFLFKKKFNNQLARRQKAYFSIYTLTSLWLIIFYGSYSIQDNISYSEITIGNSYVRYWLSIYIFALPLMVLFFKKIFSTKVGKIIALFLSTIYILFSINIVMFCGEESILNVKKNILQYKEFSKEILQKTEVNSVIISKYEDKILFPERKVINFKYQNYEIFDNIAKIIDSTPVYYYNKLIGPKDIEYIKDRKIKEYGLKLESVGSGLYKVIKK